MGKEGFILIGTELGGRGRRVRGNFTPEVVLLNHRHKERLEPPSGERGARGRSGTRSTHSRQSPTSPSAPESSITS